MCLPGILLLRKHKYHTQYKVYLTICISHKNIVTTHNNRNKISQ